MDLRFRNGGKGRGREKHGMGDKEEKGTGEGGQGREGEEGEMRGERRRKGAEGKGTKISPHRHF